MKSLILAMVLMMLAVPVMAGSWLWDGNPPNRDINEPPGYWLWDGNPPNQIAGEPPGSWLWGRYEQETPDGYVPRRHRHRKW